MLLRGGGASLEADDDQAATSMKRPADVAGPQQKREAAGQGIEVRLRSLA
jgi:hypothetical protein